MTVPIGSSRTMNVNCPNCQAVARVDEAHLPPGGSARLTCPSCNQAFQVDAPAKDAVGQGPGPELEAWLRRELDAFRSEMWQSLGAGRAPSSGTTEASGRGRCLKALICEDDATFAAQLSNVLAGLGYESENVPDVASALSLLAKKEYGLVTVDQALVGDNQGGLKILEWLNRQPGPKRRQMFVAYISSDLRTMDTGSAFIAGANLTVNKADAARLPDILSKGLEERDELYRVFDEVMDAVTAGE
jgi:predicted Zn finger-like uncharacterized protein